MAAVAPSPSLCRLRGVSVRSHGERCGCKAREFHGHFAEMSEKRRENGDKAVQARPWRVRGTWRPQSPEPSQESPADTPRE